MTDKKALEVLESWLRVAYQNADETDEDSAELFEALQTIFKLINRQQETINKNVETLLKKEDLMSKMCEENNVYYNELQYAKEEIEKLQKENTELDGANILLTVTLQNAQSEARKELAEKLKEKFSHLEYTIQTNRKTMPVERVKAEVDAVLQNGCANVIDKVLTEMKKEMVGESDV